MDKFCRKCKEVKDVGAFGKHRGNPDGLQRMCTKCRVIDNRNRRPLSKHPRNQTLEQRFWDKVDRRGDDDCWEWKAATINLRSGNRGYFQIEYKDGKQKQTYAYRVAWRIVNGEIPAGLFVCHKCDNPLCVNPHHLFLGTAKDNMQDMIRKGRQGERRKS